MNKRLIISAHTDDAIFSIGDLISMMDNVTILSIYSGIPTDQAGYEKHTLLRREHDYACDIIGVKHIELDFLDDVYPVNEAADIVNVLKPILKDYDTFFVPLGIHHPDHMQIRNIFMESFKVDFFYRDLPYATLYPELTQKLEEEYAPLRRMDQVMLKDGKKKKAIQAYESQIQNDHILNEIFVPEVIYQKL